MLENILLSAAYYESFSKFATSLKKNAHFDSKQKANIAKNAVKGFYVSAKFTGAPTDDIKALGEDLFIHVIAELDNHSASDENDADVEELQNEIFKGLMEQIDL